jgi:acyl-coenzyme A thioesterase PaaI-like protein
VHGGILATLLDEAMVYAACSLGGSWATAKTETRFRAPVPDGKTLTVRARVTDRRPKRVQVEASILDEDGRTVAEASGMILKVSDMDVRWSGKDSG